MKKLGSEKIQKYSLRKYKGIGAASVLLGMMVVGASPVLADANTAAVTPAMGKNIIKLIQN